MPFGVTFCHVFASSRVTCTSPSSEPAQRIPFSRGDSASAKIVSYTSTPVTSVVIGPPDLPCFDGSLRVRSGETSCHVSPSSVVRSRICDA
jgi:hypothetical protein